MRDLNEMELREVDGGRSTLKNLTWAGIILWTIDNWTEIKRGIYDGWTECHSSAEVDAITSAG